MTEYVPSADGTRIGFDRVGSGPPVVLVGGAMQFRAFDPATVELAKHLASHGFTVVVYNIVQVSYRQAICPPRLQGRMNSVMRFIVWGTIPIGTLLGGALGSTIGLRETIVVGAIGGGLSVLWIVLSPQRHLREMPEPLVDEPMPADLGPEVPGVGDPLTAESS